LKQINLLVHSNAHAVALKFAEFAVEELPFDNIRPGESIQCMELCSILHIKRASYVPLINTTDKTRGKPTACYAVRAAFTAKPYGTTIKRVGVGRSIYDKCTNQLIHFGQFMALQIFHDAGIDFWA
jgi:hypothetical protein